MYIMANKRPDVLTYRARPGLGQTITVSYTLQAQIDAVRKMIANTKAELERLRSDASPSATLKRIALAKTLQDLERKYQELLAKLAIAKYEEARALQKETETATQEELQKRIRTTVETGTVPGTTIPPPTISTEPIGPEILPPTIVTRPIGPDVPITEGDFSIKTGLQPGAPLPFAASTPITEQPEQVKAAGVSWPVVIATVGLAFMLLKK